MSGTDDHKRCLRIIIMNDMIKEREIKRAVRIGYAQIAKQASSCCSSRSSCYDTTPAEEIGKMMGYSKEELLAAPAESNLGLGCGNPVAIASIKEGEYVLDMGCGAGFDCFLASKATGPDGKVIGVDMTNEMVDRAKANARKGGYANVDFRQGELENMPVADDYVDLVISNCVINLVPNKVRAFKEALRVLKPGGRLIVSDIVLNKELPVFVRISASAYISCLSGAVMREDYLNAISQAGFEEVEVVDMSAFPVECLLRDAEGRQIFDIPEISSGQFADFIGLVSSIKVYAEKPTY